MNGDYGAGLSAFAHISSWTLWIGVVLLVLMIGLAIVIAIRSEEQ